LLNIPIKYFCKGNEMKLQKYPYGYVKSVKILDITLNIKSGIIMVNRLKLLKI